MNYSFRTEQFIRRMIHIRTRLLKDGSNKKDIKEMHETCDFLVTHLNAWDYSDRTMALFMFRNAYRIKQIIPGGRSASHTALMNEFDLLYYEADMILKSNPIITKKTYYEAHRN